MTPIRKTVEKTLQGLTKFPQGPSTKEEFDRLSKEYGYSEAIARQGSQIIYEEYMLARFGALGRAILKGDRAYADEQYLGYVKNQLDAGIDALLSSQEFRLPMHVLADTQVLRNTVKAMRACLKEIQGDQDGD